MTTVISIKPGDILTFRRDDGRAVQTFEVVSVCDDGTLQVTDAFGNEWEATGGTASYMFGEFADGEGSGLESGADRRGG